MRIRSRALLGVSVALLVGACHRSEVSPRVESAGPAASGRLDDHRTFGEVVEVGNLQVWPIVSDEPADVGPFLTLQEAQAQGKASVREVEAGAEVNRLVLENKGDVPILVCAGTLVKGGQQDRQIGQDFIALAHSTVPVDAFCVEHGRWTGDTCEFAAMACMSTSAVRASAQYDGDQSKVWDEVATIARAAKVAPATGTLVSAFEVADPEIVTGREKFEQQVRATFDRLLASESAVVGFAYAIDGKPVTVRTFAHPSLLRSQLEPFVRTMSIEAELAARGRDPADPNAAPRRATIEDVVALVRSAASAAEETVKTEAGNENRYRKGELAASSACFLSSLGFSGAAITQDWSARPAAPAKVQIEIRRDDAR
jgi:hypothetical protein